MKKNIEDDIQNDFNHALNGIAQLPSTSKFGVYVAYKYYLSLFNKIKKTSPSELLEKRIRINNLYKTFIIIRSRIANQLGVL